MNNIQQIIEGVEDAVTVHFSDSVKSIYFEKYTDTGKDNRYPQLSYYFSEDMFINLNSDTVGISFELLDQVSGLNDKDDRRKNIISDNFSIASSLITKLKSLGYRFEDSVSVVPFSSRYKNGLGGVEFTLNFNLQKPC